VIRPVLSVRCHRRHCTPESGRRDKSLRPVGARGSRSTGETRQPDPLRS
jgi:hypothetical protein